MYVIVYMLAAEAVVARTAGAVAELQIRIVHIGFAADRALVGVEPGLLLITDAGGFLAEVNGTLAGLSGKKGLEIPGAENEEVKQRHNRQQIYGERIADNRHKEEHRIYKSKELHAHGNHKHEQHLHIRIHRREGEEH